MSDTGDLEAVETEESSGETEAEPPEVSEDESNAEERAAADRAHLEDVEDGCGCAEVWEHLSEQRDD